MTHKKHRFSHYGLGLLTSLALIPTASHAATIDSIINNGVAYLQGPVARGLGILTIVGCGYLCIFKQSFPKEQFAMVLLGLGVIFGASALYSTLVG